MEQTNTQTDKDLPVIQIKEEPGVNPTSFCNKERSPYNNGSTASSPKSQTMSPMVNYHLN